MTIFTLPYPCTKVNNKPAPPPTRGDSPNEHHHPQVTTGENMPTTTREAPGTVPASSLATSSAHKGGAFTSNTGTNKTASETSSGTKTKTRGGGSLANEQSYGGPFPIHPIGQQRRDPAGRHGKKLRREEGGFEGSGTAGDPALIAVCGSRATTAAAVSGGGRIPRWAAGATEGIRFGDAEVVSRWGEPV
ncbi:hypothetical protein F5144DRAFT_586040 [Chaetomium tenue]|uniref:Uncharacterized protein n=1 Tax=Chaetomium tenue TaxID=1854479 RepID=A0ACB7NWV3_9PEZI|nr:hypothetical protein F5144DRAFT_586040 [Chaetomium globosum]